MKMTFSTFSLVGVVQIKTLRSGRSCLAIDCPSVDETYQYCYLFFNLCIEILRHFGCSSFPDSAAVGIKCIAAVQNLFCWLHRCCANG